MVLSAVNASFLPEIPEGSVGGWCGAVMTGVDIPTIVAQPDVIAFVRQEVGCKKNTIPDINQLS